MATRDDLEKAIKRLSLEDIELILEQARNALQNAASYRFGGRQYTPSELRDLLVPSLERVLKTKSGEARAETARAEKAARAAATQPLATTELQRLLEQQAFVNAQAAELARVEQAAAFGRGETTQEQFVAAVEPLKRAQEAYSDALANYQESLKAIGIADKTPKTAKALKAEVDRARARAKAYADAEQQRLLGVQAARLQGQVDQKTPTKAPTPTPTKTPTPTDTAASAGAPAPSEWVETQLELRGLEDTPANRKMLQDEYKSQKPTVWDDAVQQEFLTRYPQYSYLFDAEVFGDSADAIKSIAVRAITEKWYRYPTTMKSVISRLIAATPYGIRSTDSQEKFDALGLAEQNAKVDQKVNELKGLYGSLGLDDTTWRTLAKTAARNALDEATTRANLFKTIYETTPEGAMRYDKAIRILEQGRLGQEVRKTYRDYGLNPNDPNVASDIQAYTTGSKTLEDIKSQVVGLAKDMFPALATSIDRGSTVKQVADQYAAYAADILELPIQSVDMTTTKFRKAFEGDKLMSIGEWQKMLRTDPNYGWQYTTTANKQALDIGTAIARAFGAVK
jgi:hypothetical protein